MKKLLLIASAMLAVFTVSAATATLRPCLGEGKQLKAKHLSKTRAGRDCRPSVFDVQQLTEQDPEIVKADIQPKSSTLQLYDTDSPISVSNSSPKAGETVKVTFRLANYTYYQVTERYAVVMLDKDYNILSDIQDNTFNFTVSARTYQTCEVPFNSFIDAVLEDTPVYYAIIDPETLDIIGGWGMYTLTPGLIVDTTLNGELKNGYPFTLGLTYSNYHDLDFPIYVVFFEVNDDGSFGDMILGSDSHPYNAGSSYMNKNTENNTGTIECTVPKELKSPGTYYVGTCLSTRYILTMTDKPITIGGTTGVEDLESDAEEAPEQLYDLQGRPVARDNALPGVYISVKGDKTSKVLIK